MILLVIQAREGGLTKVQVLREEQGRAVVEKAFFGEEDFMGVRTYLNEWTKKARETNDDLIMTVLKTKKKGKQ